MIGSIIQVARDLLKGQGKNIENWQEEASEGKEVLDQQTEKMEKQAQQQPEQEEKVEVEAKQEEVEQSEQPKEPQEDKKEESEETKEAKQGMLLSDEKTKDIKKENLKSDEEYAKETGGQIFNIIQGVRKEIANVGKAMRGDKDTKEAGTDLYQSIKPVVESKKNYDEGIEKLDERMKAQKDSGTSTVPSDTVLKTIFSNDSFHDPDILNAYKNLDTIQFTYTDEATEIDPTQDTETMHTGLKAQDIQAQPELAAAVKEDPESGYLMVDTRELTMSNAAAISELTKLVEELKQKIESLGG